MNKAVPFPVLFGQVGEIRRIPGIGEGIKVDYLCEALQCSRTELFSRLITEEWTRQGEPGPR